MGGLGEEMQWKLTERAVRGKNVLLNRQPTLHRLGVQAFRPKLVPGSALCIPPLVCGPFNADFDGDTMAIHVSLSEEAIKDAQQLMAPSANLCSPASGDATFGPTQDMVLGIYYLTVAEPDMTRPV